MKVRVLAVIGIMAMMMSFWSCQKKEEAVSLGPIKVGVILPLTGKHAKFGEIGVASEDFAAPRVLIVGEAMLLDNFGCDYRITAHTALSTVSTRRESKRKRPSPFPMIGSASRSGWGMRPKTFFFPFMMPAMARAEPLTLKVGSFSGH